MAANAPTSRPRRQALRSGRSRLAGLALLLAATLGPAAGYAQAPARDGAGPAEPVRRVRPMGPRAEYTVGRAIELCPTVRGLVEALNASDLIVYVMVVHRTSGPAGWIRFVGGSPDARYVSVQLRDDLSTPQMVMLVGHELQHALEVAQAPAVRDRAAFEAFYNCPGFGTNEPNRFDTPGAIRIGYQVRKELALKGLLK